MLDSLIIGGGPAGLTAGIYLMRAGLSCALYEKQFCGGQAATTNWIENYPGFPDGIGGPELSMAMAEQAQKLGLEIRYDEITELHLTDTERYAIAGGKRIDARTVVLCMKGLEMGTGARLSQIAAECLHPSNAVAVWLGPGHVQDYMKNVPSAAVIDSLEEGTKDYLIKLLQSDLIRFYYGSDLIGNQIGAALKNVIGLAAGILDGLEWYGLKGALMARAPVEVGRLIRHFGGNPMSAYGLAHLGDYEATLFSKYSHNRSYGEAFAKGERFAKLAEGVPTLKAVKIIADKEGIDMPICQALYKAIYENADIEQTIRSMFERDLKREF